MNSSSTKKENRQGFLLAIFSFLSVMALIAWPYFFQTEASVDRSREGLFTRTVSHDPELPNYDIRNDKSSYGKIAEYRQSPGKNAIAIADIRDGFVRGEESLRERVPTLKIEYNTDIRIPEVIAPDVKKGKAVMMRATGEKRSDILKNFLRQNSELVGATPDQIGSLKVAADYTNPDGRLSFVELNQEINGIPVFRGEVKAGFNTRGEMFRVINNFAPGLDHSSLSADFGDPVNAVRSAAANIKYDLTTPDVTFNEAASTDIKAVFGGGDWATTAEKMYFPTEPGVAVPAWRVLIWQPVNAYYVIVDAHNGTVLWRKNLGEDQTQTATYDVYDNPNALTQVADNPGPMTPGPINPTSGMQGTLLTRSSVTLVGNEGDLSFNNLGWITDGSNITDGNAVEAGLDIASPDGVDAPETGSPNRVFSSTWNPPPGNPAPGDAPSATQARRGAVIQMFYAMNRYHDELYKLGFTEPARNFQNNNFGRGGNQNDRVSAQGQDFSGTNNANFNTPADGGRGRMQMYVFTGANPDRDGTTDVEIIYHEVTHGTSNRLHGNGSGLSTNMSRAMGEGWGDFYAMALLSEPSDPLDGTYAEGGYALFGGFGVVGTQNYYYGIRRFPKARMSFTGGPNNRPHNPMTFADIDATQRNTSDGAFAAMSGPHISTVADQVHAAGEVWSSALWEVRCLMVDRLGWEQGNTGVLQFVTDGMKLAPLGPTFLQERDAIIAAAQESGTGDDVADIWNGFAIRGMGYSSQVTNPGSGSNDARVVEAFDLPNLAQDPAFTVSDAAGDGDGYPEPGEQISLSIPLTNETGTAATGVTLQVVGGGSANYGTIANGETVTRNVTFTVPNDTPCGTPLALTFNVNSSLGSAEFERSLNIGAPTVVFTENFDGVTAPSLPSGWTGASVSGGPNFVNSTLMPDSGPNAAYAQEPTSVGGGSDLTSPSIAIASSAATLSFRHRYNSEAGWDGGVLEIKIGSGGFQDIVTAGGSFIENGYVGTLGPNGANNPLAGRNSWNGDSGGYITSVVQLPPSAGGQNVQLKWRFGSDDNTVGSGPNPGWFIDNVSIVGDYECNVTPSTGSARADFDGDGKTDVSVYRPSTGTWYVNQSTDGFTGLNFGAATDELAPGDFDGDGKTDFAIYRATDGSADYDFWVLRSSDLTVDGRAWGMSGDLSAVGDYDGNGKDDFAVWRNSEGAMYILYDNGTYAIVSFALSFDDNEPVPGDYDGDGKTDVAVFREVGSVASWVIYRSSDGTFTPLQFGNAGDVPAQGDYDGDGTADMATFRPSEGVWYIRNSSDESVTSVTFGASGDIPAPGDYDGDGKEDIAVVRNGTWWINGSTSGLMVQLFGFGTDKPIPAADRP